MENTNQRKGKGRGRRLADVAVEHAEAMGLPRGKVLQAISAITEAWKKALAEGQAIELPVGELIPSWSRAKPRLVSRGQGESGWLAQESRAPARRFLANTKPVRLNFRHGLEFIGANATPVAVGIDRRHLLPWRPGEMPPAAPPSPPERPQPQPDRAPAVLSPAEARRQARMALLEHAARQMGSPGGSGSWRTCRVPSRTDAFRRW
jgi:hypothetical protein